MKKQKYALFSKGINTILPITRTYHLPHTLPKDEGKLAFIVENCGTGAVLNTTMTIAGNQYGTMTDETLRTCLLRNTEMELSELHADLHDTDSLDTVFQKTCQYLACQTQTPLYTKHTVLEYLARNKQIDLNKIQAIVFKYTPQTSGLEIVIR